MRPQLPSIRPTVLITGASASDRGWTRTTSETCAHTLLLYAARLTVVRACDLSRPQSGPQPCRCLCRGFSQITITRPCRRITLHLSQILLTLGWTFIELPYELPPGKRQPA